MLETVTQSTLAANIAKVYHMCVNQANHLFAAKLILRICQLEQLFLFKIDEPLVVI